MRKIILCLGIIMVLSFFSSSVFAADDRQPKTVTGKVLDDSGAPVANAQVTIICGSSLLTDTTSSAGNYEVIYADGACVQFDTITATADHEGKQGSSTRTVTFARGVGMPIITLMPVTVAVPEMGVLSAIMAGSLSLVTYVTLKRSS